MDPITALGILCSMIEAAQGIPSGIQQFVALIRTAAHEERDIQPAEIEALRLDDDELQKALDAAIARAKENP